MKRLCIYGGSGTLGQALIERYQEIYQITVVSRDEWKQWGLSQKYRDVKFVLGDIRNVDSVRKLIKVIQPDIIINCAALKHIDVCERSTSECLLTNVQGTQNLVMVAGEEKIDTLVFISTDKACSPVNVYGMSKSLSERIMVEASVEYPNTRFVCVRYGNVLNSRGSIIPKFYEIGISDQSYFPVTHPDMTRFFMKVEDSVELIHQAITNGVSGDTWIPILQSFKISDLAQVFANRYNKEIKIIGVRAGEKLHECLINQEEIARTFRYGSLYFVIKPCYRAYTGNNGLDREYTSESTTSISELAERFKIEI